MDEIKYTIYRHINKINGKSYVGVTSQRPEDRWANGKGYKGCRKFYPAIQKYGWDNFEHEILDIVYSPEEASEKEKYWINQYNTTSKECGYNIDGGGYDHKIMSDETRKIFSIAHSGEKNGRYGMPVSEETRRKISKANKGRLAGKNNPMYGKTHTDEIKKKLSEINKVQKPFLSKPIYCITTNKIFLSHKEAGEYYNISSPSHISDVCNNKRSYCGKEPYTNKQLVWRYATEEEETQLYLERGLERDLNVKRKRGKGACVSSNS